MESSRTAVPTAPVFKSLKNAECPSAPLFDEPELDPPDEPLEAGAVGVNVTSVFARQALTASFNWSVPLGALSLIVALPAKSHDATLLSVSS